MSGQDRVLSQILVVGPEKGASLISNNLEKLACDRDGIKILTKIERSEALDFLIGDGTTVALSRFFEFPSEDIKASFIGNAEAYCRAMISIGRSKVQVGFSKRSSAELVKKLETQAVQLG